VLALTDADATYTGIHRAFQRFIKQVGEDDLFLFYFSGRGSRIGDDLFIDELDEFDECLLPFDAEGASGFNFLRDDEIGQFLQRLKTPNTIVIIDAAYGGGGPGDKGFTKLAMAPKPGRRYDGFEGYDSLPADALVLEACLPDSTTEDGRFAAVLIEALLGKADPQDDGIILLSDVAAYLGVQLPSQQPRLSGGGNAALLSLVQPLLEVRTEPLGAAVVVDSDTLGVTPGRFVISRGRHGFSVYKSGYQVPPSIAPIIEISEPGKLAKLVRLQVMENRFTLRLTDASGRPLIDTDVLFNADPVGRTNALGQLEITRRLGPEALNTLTLKQLGLVLDRRDFDFSEIQNGHYSIEAAVDISPVSLTIVDIDGKPLPGLNLEVNQVGVGITDGLGRVEFGERLIGGRSKLAQINLQINRYGRTHEVPPQNIQLSGETAAVATLDFSLGRIVVQACVDSLALGANLAFQGTLYLDAPTPQNQCGDHFPTTVEAVLPGGYTFIVVEPSEAVPSENGPPIQISSGQTVTLCVPVGLTQAWAQTLSAHRRQPASSEILRQAEALARRLERQDLVRLFQTQKEQAE